jgi:hypothetical protein
MRPSYYLTNSPYPRYGKIKIEVVASHFPTTQDAYIYNEWL